MEDISNPHVYSPSSTFQKFVRHEIEKLRHLKPDSSLAFMQMADEFCRAHCNGPHRLPSDSIIFGKPQKDIFSLLFDKVMYLTSNRFRYENGTATALIIGAKGIGKTTSILNFMYLCPAIFPTCIPIYISFESILGSPLEGRTIFEVVEGELRRFSIRPDKKRNDYDSLGHRLIRGLEYAGKFVLLVCDELDKLYEVNSPTMSLNLTNFSMLGNTKAGRIVTLLCGSSSWMEHLIRAKASVSHFPLMSRPNNLNSTKYRTKRISSSLPTDLSSIQLMIPNSPVEHRRCVLFFCGANARFVLQGLKSAGGLDEAITGEGFMSLSNRSLSKRELSLRNGIMTELWSQNKTLLCSLFKHTKSPPQGELCWNSLGTCEFEKEFKPLTFETFKKIWKKTHSDDPELEMETAIRNLIDYTQFCFDRVEEHAPREIYPTTVYQVIAANRKILLTPAWHEEVKTAVTLKEFWSEGGKGLVSKLMG